jgi:hypothetical protein
LHLPSLLCIFARSFAFSWICLQLSKDAFSSEFMMTSDFRSRSSQSQQVTQSLALIFRSQTRRKASVELVFVLGLCSFLFSAISPIDDDIQQEAFSSDRGSVLLHIAKDAAKTPTPDANKIALASAIQVAEFSTQRYFEEFLDIRPSAPQALILPRADRSPPSLSL